jgi:membrane-associated phospholipid phosphatase
VRQVEDVLHESARLGDREKAIAEYWSDGPASELPPGHWCLLAGWVVERDALGLDDQVKLFFALGNALMDAGITAWDAKRAYDTVRPITAIRTLKAGKPIRAWGGPGLGTVQMPGEGWMPFQAATFVTPPFPEYVSGHSTFSMAAATVLARFTGSDRFGHAVTLGAGSSRLEPGRSPARPVTLAWPTFTAAADEAGLSRRYGGIHFVDGDLAGRALGREVGERVWARARMLWTGGDAGSEVGDGAVALVTR